MKLCLKILLLILVPVLEVGQVFSQEFTNSPAMAFFNQGKYEQAAREILRWIPQHPEEEGIARYYLGEAYYNLGVQESRKGKAQEFFRKAHTEFDRALKFPGLKSEYPKVYYFSQLKKGWCYFRRAESGEQPQILFDNAFKDFLSLDSDAPDSMAYQANYMAAFARLLESRLRRFSSVFPETDISEVNRAVSVLLEAKKLFHRVAVNSPRGTMLSFFAAVQESNANFELGKLYQNLASEEFERIADENKKSTPLQTALYYFDQAKFEGLKARLPATEKERLESLLHYLEALKWLNRYFVTFAAKDKQNFLAQLRLAEASIPRAEAAFRRGNADHNTLQIEGNEAFVNLYQNSDASYYFKALPRGSRPGIDESYFWLGSVQYVVSRPEGIGNLNSYIQQHMTEFRDPRVLALLEYARYWRGVLYLENYRSNMQRLRELKNFLTVFNPKIPLIEKRKNLLLKLTQLELGERIEGVVISGTQTAAGLSEALEIIRYLLRRAANYTGVSRLHYLDLVARMFQITSEQRSNETLFYQGIERSLRAEIQGDDEEKIRFFLESAEILSMVKPPYKDEADYIRARSLFFAEKYDEAKKIFIRLINEKHSLRSLFYFGEILRLQGYGDAAKRCFEVVKEKTLNNPEGKFWYLNAEASISLCENKKEGFKELQNVNIEGVEFPDRLLPDPASSYEKLADRKFVLYQYLQESLEVLRKFGLPKLMIYPSANVLANSMWKDRIYPGLPPLFDEMLRRETSVLEVIVLARPEEIPQLEVKVNDVPLQALREGVFESKRLNVGDRVVLTISGPTSYLFKKEFYISKPGRETLWAPLTPRVTFRPASAVQPELTIYRLPERMDRDYIVQKASFTIPEDSQLEQDLRRDFYLRDVVFHPVLKSFLVTDARYVRGFRRYSISGERLEDAEYFDVDFGDYEPGQFLSPEGLALDSEKTLYVTDFGAHRVIVFDSTGNYKYHFGDFGRNTPDRLGQEIRLAYPTRIAVEEDQQGVSVKQDSQEIRVFRNTYLFVADRYGIYRCDREGHYLETVLDAQSANLEPGELYALGIDGYGEGARLFLVDRKTGQIRVFQAVRSR